VAAGLGCSIVVSIILFIGGGVLLDQVTDSAPLFTLIGVALGLLAAGYQLYELATFGKPNRRPGPITRQITRLPGRRSGPPDREYPGPMGDKRDEE
jgi:hypothetical protein